MDVDWKAPPPLPSLHLFIGHNFTNRGARNDGVSARSRVIIADHVNILAKEVSF